jgi:hypothetical protein
LSQLRVSSFEFQVAKALAKRLSSLKMTAEEYVRLTFDRALERPLRGGAGFPLAELP